ncbi:4-alpha-glucanotransferase [Psychrilyobacter atlanticus]|uniref:4-alpha-glucanotransferase n=1 Tax=Psychrilyobacter atlanticus TaxID=271091 RepID=UPI0003FE22BE|nr:4-alpha-glucanotransferase [Psychrilyobacter atlanticus]
MFERSSGILLHISSLGGDGGIGTFGKEAYEFVDFLKKSGQKLWQILPLGTTSYGDSPYQSFSAFAGNPYFIDLEELIDRGGLDRREVKDTDLGDNREYIDYEKLYKNKLKLLKKAYLNEGKDFLEEIEKFKKKHIYWIDDYALFMALKDKNDGIEWTKWVKEEKFAHINTLKKYRIELKDKIDYYIYLQYLFYTQWGKLKNYANENKVKIIGDLPIFISGDSVDAWLKTELFLFDEKKNIKVVAGCPPDAFSSTGQLWGNPLYNWKIMRRRGYSWWIERMRAAFELYDMVRIDHFRGFESYWEIPADAPTARPGKWVKGPGIEVFKAIKNGLGDLPIIAEDLGFLTKGVRKLLKDSGYPGMKILEFAFDSREESDYLPHKYPENSAAYTGTHDNETVVGWYKNVVKDDKEHAEKYLKKYLKLKKFEGEKINDVFIEAIWKSNSDLTLAQMQDFLGLDNRARMNIPSTLGNNWKWRLKGDELTDELAEKIKEMTIKYGR